MDANGYAHWIEQNHLNDEALEQMRERIAVDRSLSDDDKEALDGRIGMYLADNLGVNPDVGEA